MEESPRFLIKIGQLVRARAILEKIEVSSIEEEIEEIKLSLSLSTIRKQTLFSAIYFKPISIAF